VTENVTRPDAKKQTEAIRYMIHERLRARLATESSALENHLDEDAICAFVEGRLEEAEVSPVISHLIACASCRQTTAQLVRFDSQFDPENELTPLEESTGRVPLLLDRLASRLAPSFEEDAVFAYQDPAAEPDHGTEVITESKPGTADDVD
jgi:anti-sigma factor RsiW